MIRIIWWIWTKANRITAISDPISGNCKIDIKWTNTFKQTHFIWMNLRPVRFWFKSDLKKTTENQRRKKCIFCWKVEIKCIYFNFFFICSLFFFGFFFRFRYTWFVIFQVLSMICVYMSKFIFLLQKKKKNSIARNGIVIWALDLYILHWDSFDDLLHNRSTRTKLPTQTGLFYTGSYVYALIWTIFVRLYVTAEMHRWFLCLSNFFPPPGLT